jgi:integrase
VVCFDPRSLNSSSSLEIADKTPVSPTDKSSRSYSGLALVKVPRSVSEEIRPLDREQAKILLETARDERFEALYVLAVTTGLRQSDLLGLKWEDVDLGEGLVRVKRTLTRRKGRSVLGEPKTKGSRRTVRLTYAAERASRITSPIEQYYCCPCLALRAILFPARLRQAVDAIRDELPMFSVR